MASRLQDLLKDQSGFLSMADLDALEAAQRGQSIGQIPGSFGPGQGSFQRSGGNRIDLTPQGWQDTQTQQMMVPQGQPMGNEDLQLDYANPLDFGGAKGYRLKGDSTRALLNDGRMVDLMGGERLRQQAAQQQAQAKADERQLDMDIKRQQLDNAKSPKWKIDMDNGVAINESDPRQVIPLSASGFQRKPPKLSATSEKELYEADEMANVAQGAMKSLQAAKLLSEDKDTYSGAGAVLRAKIMSNLPFESAGADKTIQLDNIIREQALTGMKAIFGGNPTEGERAILMEIQASADKTPAQRKALIERGIAMAESRMKWNQNKANDIRSGGIFQVNQQQPEAPAQPSPQPSNRRPEPGMIKNGYLYIGGDPNKQSSWKAAK